MRIPLVLFLIFFWCSVCFAASSFVFIATIPQSAPSAFRREVRIVAANYASWEYVACVADTFDPYSAEEIAKVYTLSIYSNYSRDIQAGVAPNNGTMTFALTVIQGLPECGYAALVNTTLYNVIGDDSRESDLPKGNWQAPFYAVWSNNQVQTFLGTDTSVASRLNVTTTGTYSYSASDDGFQGITAWELYREPTSSTTYIAYSLVLYQSINVLKLKSVVHKCNPTCTRDATLGSSTTALPTITANSTHWFSCYKEVTIVDNSVIDSVAYKCTVSGLADYTYSMPQVDKDFPLETSSFRTIMNSCVVDKTTMLLLMVNDTGGYTIYALDTTAAFAITSFINGTAYATSITCADQAILVGTLDGLDYYAWDSGTGVSFPPPPVPSVPVPLDAPVVVDAPVVTPNSAVNQNNTGELSANDKVVLGVVIGVGVPLIAGAVVLIVFRKKVQKKPPKDEEGAVYTTINELNKLIPFNQLTFTKEIGVGSYSKVFLGTWQGKKVAIKMNNQVADAEGFMAEARLTLSMPFHPNLVETYGISMNSDRPYIVQEYCEGGSLDKIVFNKIIDRQEQRALVFGIAQGLLHLHSNKIVHRDLAVRNILLKDGVPKISDFGMSRVLKDKSEQGKTNNTVGPIRWMAPESIDDMTYSPKSDVWTFGIVVSEIVLGHEPHHDKNQLDIAVKIRDVGFAPSIPDSCDPVLKELMQMCWKLDPEDRPTMRQIVEFLNENTDAEL